MWETSSPATVEDKTFPRASEASNKEISCTSNLVSRAEVLLLRSCESFACEQGCELMVTLAGRGDIADWIRC
jgi:hypothetical protein